MTRIGASISGFERLLLNHLNRTNSAAALNSLRLATNKRINSPAEDPAAFFQISSLENRLSIVNKTLTQVSAASLVTSKTQLSLDQIRTQLDTIRAALLTDEDQSLDTTTRAAKQSEIDSALDQINTLAGTEINGRRILDGSADYRVSGLNNTQIRNLTVLSSGSSSQPISGEVFAAATQGTLTHTGVGGLITADADFTLTGDSGITTISVTNTESLTDVRDRINLDSHKTGITASVSGDDLVFTTVNYGTDATIAVKVTSGTFAVTGGNGDGTDQGTNVVVDVNGQTILANSPASKATLIFTDLDNKLDVNTDFRLTGGSGFFDFSFNANDSLSTIATAIDAKKATTGVEAVVAANGIDIVLTSTAFGTTGSITLEVTTGQFAVLPGNESTVTVQTAAEPGQIFYTGTPDDKVVDTASIDITGPLGTASINLTQGHDIDHVVDKINDETGNTGVQATLVNNNQVVITSTTTGSAAFVDIDVTSGTFTITGGDAGGRDYGVDEKTVVIGSDAVTTETAIDGNSVTFNNRLTISKDGLHVVIEFAAGFTGKFDALRISDDSTLKFALTTNPGVRDTLGLPGFQTLLLGGLSGTLNDLYSGESLSGLATNTSQAIRVVDEALSQLTLVEGRVDAFADVTIASSTSLLDSFKTTLTDSLTDINGVNTTEESLLLTKNQLMADNILSSLTILQQQRGSFVTILKRIAGLI